MTSIWDYFKPSCSNTTLPDPDGPLKEEIRPSTICDVNKIVSPLIGSAAVQTSSNASPSDPKRRPSTRESYIKLTPEQKAIIGRRAAGHGVTAAIRYFSKRYDDLPLKEPTVRRLKNTYLSELKRQRTEPEDITELPPKKRGRPLLLGKGLDKMVKAYITSLRTSGSVVNTAITLACAEGIVRSEDPCSLQVNGGHISLTKHWAKNFLRRIGYVKRKGTTKAKVSVENFTALKDQFLLDVKSIACIHHL